VDVAGTIAPTQPANGFTGEQADKLIERVTYLASLASRLEDVDPMMDALRSVTVRWHQSEQMSPNDQAALEGLERKLKDYLLHSDPLRNFTPQSLEQRLQDQTVSQSSFLKVHHEQATLVISGSLGVTILTMALLPNSIAFSDRLMIAMQPFYTILCIGTIWFYLSALRNFRRELRHSFILMCLAVICMGVSFSVYAAITLLKGGDLEVFKYGGLLWTVTLSFIFLYLGLRVYARLIGLKNAFTSLWNVVAMGLVLGAAAVLVPHASRPTSEFFFDLSFASAVVYTGVAIFGSILALGIAKNVTAAFRRSMHWIFIYQLTCVPGAIIGSASLYYLGRMNGRTLNLELALAGIVPLLLLFYTGYSFKKETSK